MVHCSGSRSVVRAATGLSAFEQRHGTDGPGNQSFEPRMVVKVMIYG